MSQEESVAPNAATHCEESQSPELLGDVYLHCNINLHKAYASILYFVNLPVMLTKNECVLLPRRTSAGHLNTHKRNDMKSRLLWRC